MNDQRGSNSLGRASLLVCGVVTTAVFLGVCFFSVFALGNGATSFFDTPSIRLSDGWTDGAGNAVTLPQKFSYPQNGSYTLRTSLPETWLLKQDLSLLFSAKYLNVTLFLDGEEIGSCFGKPEGAQKLMGKTYLMTALPEDVAGKELRIEAIPLLEEDLEYEINAPMLGTGERLVYDLIRSDLPMLVILAAITCFGLLLMLFSWQARKTGNRTFFQTGLFAILFALYSLCITDTVHLFLNSPQLIYLMEFLLLALSPLPLLVLVYHVCLPKFRPILLVNIGVLTLNFCLQAALYFFTGVELRDMVQLTHTIFALPCLF